MSIKLLSALGVETAMFLEERHCEFMYLVVLRFSVLWFLSLSSILRYINSPAVFL